MKIETQSAGTIEVTVTSTTEEQDGTRVNFTWSTRRQGAGQGSILLPPDDTLPPDYDLRAASGC